jgi:methionyl-tRNA formyltransferase
MAAGTAHEEPQDEHLATYAARLTKDEGLIDWSLSAARIHDRVRGLHPWPHAYSFVNGRRIIVWRTSPQPETAAAAPGTVLRADADGWSSPQATGTRSRCWNCRRKADGRCARRMFLRGHPVSPGACFQPS